jgi:hypothetical protein
MKLLKLDEMGMSTEITDEQQVNVLLKRCADNLDYSISDVLAKLEAGEKLHYTHHYCTTIRSLNLFKESVKRSYQKMEDDKTTCGNCGKYFYRHELVDGNLCEYCFDNY